MLTSQIPSAVVGDFDSIDPHVKDHFQAKGSTVIEDKDQYSTDFGKSVRAFRNQMKTPTGSVVVLCDMSGRLDQGIGILHEILRETLMTHTSSLKLWLVGDENISWILSPGRSIIRGLRPSFGDDAEKLFTAMVGILPIYGPAVISTGGLKWDVTDWRTRMGGNVSTSNHVVANEIVIETSHEVLFTVERKTLDR
jgi:thiamine pyrophosphokinase